MKIIIIGGGLGGLTLAHLLAQQSPDFKVTIYERDTDSVARQQGFYIGLNSDGRRILEKILPRVPELAKILDLKGENNTPKSMNVADSNLSLLLKIPLGRRISLASRWGLRTTLAQNLDIVWNKKFDHYEESDSQVFAFFSDGTKVGGDFLIAADGARSQVRQQKCVKANDGKGFLVTEVGVTTMFGLADGSLLQELPNLDKVLEFTRFHTKTGMNLLMSRYYADTPNPSLQICWFLSWPTSEEDKKEGESWSIQGVPESKLTKEQQYKVWENQRDRALKLAKIAFGNSSEILTLIEKTPIDQIIGSKSLLCTDPNVTSNPYLSEPGKRSRVVLLGDAAHPMTPHRGIGANTAFVDCEVLSETLSQCTPENWKGKLDDYEQDLFKRGFSAAKSSLGSSHLIHITGWRASMRDWMFWTFGWLSIPYQMYVSWQNS